MAGPAVSPSLYPSHTHTNTVSSITRTIVYAVETMAEGNGSHRALDVLLSAHALFSFSHLLTAGAWRGCGPRERQTDGMIDHLDGALPLPTRRLSSGAGPYARLQILFCLTGLNYIFFLSHNRTLHSMKTK